jgi:hypothetical protein
MIKLTAAARSQLISDGDKCKEMASGGTKGRPDLRPNSLRHSVDLMDGASQPTALKRASNFARAGTTKPAQWRQWQNEAEAIWKNHPNLSRHSVARLVKRRLQVSEQADSIARRIHK